jgi:uncharacterized protein (DUF2141 family)
MRLFAIVPAFVLIWLLAGGTPDNQLQTSATLTISIDEVRNSKGLIGVLVFRSAQGWPEKVDAASFGKAVEAHPGVTTLVIDDLPSGTYAVVALHDENENQKLDRNFFGMPKEGWGMSNNPKAYLSAPSYSQARFVLKEDTHLQIHLNY